MDSIKRCTYISCLKAWFHDPRKICKQVQAFAWFLNILVAYCCIVYYICDVPKWWLYVPMCVMYFSQQISLVLGYQPTTVSYRRYAPIGPGKLAAKLQSHILIRFEIRLSRIESRYLLRKGRKTTEKICSDIDLIADVPAASLEVGLHTVQARLVAPAEELAKWANGPAFVVSREEHDGVQALQCCFFQRWPKGPCSLLVTFQLSDVITA